MLLRCWGAGVPDRASLFIDMQHSHKTNAGVCLLLHLQALAPAYEPEVWQQLGNTAAASSSSSSSNSAVSRPSKRRPVPGPPKPPSAQQQQQAGLEPNQKSEPQQQAAQALQIAAMPLQLLADTILAHQQEQGSGSCSSSGGGSGACRRSALRLSVKFRAHKKMLLADVLLASPVPLQQLVRQAQLLQAYKAASAAARLSPSRVDTSMLEDALPWQC
jgi:hypothetical protein